MEGYAGRTWGIDFEALWRDLEAWAEHASRVADAPEALKAGPQAPPTITWLDSHDPDPLPVEED